MEAEALLDALANTLGEIKAEMILPDRETNAPINTINQSLAEVEAEASDNTLADSLAEVKAQKVGETLTDVKGASLFLTLAATLAMERSQDGWKNTGRRGGQGTGTCLLTRYHRWWPNELKSH